MGTVIVGIIVLMLIINTGDRNDHKEVNQVKKKIDLCKNGKHEVKNAVPLMSALFAFVCMMLITVIFPVESRADVSKTIRGNWDSYSYNVITTAEEDEPAEEEQTFEEDEADEEEQIFDADEADEEEQTFEEDEADEQEQTFDADEADEVEQLFDADEPAEEEQEPDSWVTRRPDKEMDLMDKPFHPYPCITTAALGSQGKTLTAAPAEKKLPKNPVLSLKLKKAGKRSISISWNAIKGADGYIVYGSRCGKKEMKKLAVNDFSTRFSYTKMGLKKGTYYKFKVKAFKYNSGKRKTVVSSNVIHAATSGGKYSNKIGVKLSSKKISIKHGKSKKISAKQVRKGKKTKVRFHAGLTFRSTNKSVAKVSKNGKVKAVGKGKCSILVYAQNGKYKKVKVTVR